MDSYDIIADTVRKYWNEVSRHPCDVIAFFYQRYDYESDNDWRFEQELCMPYSSDDFNTVEFLDDFCEGETEVKDIRIVPLDDILDYYVETKLTNDIHDQ